MITYTTSNLVKKGFVLILTAILVFSIAPPAPVHAQTNADIQAQITALIAQLDALIKQFNQLNLAVAVCPYSWTRDLGIGDRGDDVLWLQKFLNKDVNTQIAFSGPGSPGFETSYYGPLTATAVAKFQAKYRSEVLTPHGFGSPTNFLGWNVRAKMNALCATAPTPVVKPPVVIPPKPSPLTGSANLERFRVLSGQDTSLEEAQRNASIMDVEFLVEDGDVIVNRIEVAFEYIDGDEDEPWDTFDEVLLQVNDEWVARKDVSDEDNWRKNSPFSGAHTVRFSGLDIRVDEGETFEFTVAVTLQNHIDGAEDGLSWDVFIPDEGIRVLDGRATESIGDEKEKVNIDIGREGDDDELAIRHSTKDPDSTTLHLERNKNSDWITVFAFDLDTGDSQNDIEIESLPVSLTVSTETVNTFIRDVRLVVGGKNYSDVSITDGLSNYMQFRFRSGEFVIDAGDKETVMLQVMFKSLPSIYEGVTIKASANSANIKAEGADDLEDSQLSGAATSDLHQLRTEGALVDGGSSSASLIVNSTTDLTDDEGSFKINFNVTAFESDLYVNRSAVRGSVLGTSGVNFEVIDSDGDVTSAGDVVSALSSSAPVVGGQFYVREGETERFTLNVDYDPSTKGFYRLRLYSLNYATSQINPTTQQRTLPTERYETEMLSI